MGTLAYLRRSSAPAADTRTVSFEMQEASIRELASRHGDSIDRLLTDWARSGKDTKRAGYQSLRAAIMADEVSTVYSYSLSRLSRSLLDFADLLELCKQHDVSIRLVQEGTIDWKSATGRAFAGMAAVFAQMEREIAAERIQSAVDARRERGDHLGQAPYGYRVAEGRLVRREDEDPDAVLQAFLDAGSFGRAARLLNEREVPTRRRGTAWNHGTVADIIRQQFPDTAPRATSRAKAKPRTGRLLAGLLACPCGSILTPRTFRGRLMYYCSRSYRVPAHGKTTIREQDILPWAMEEAALLRPLESVTVVEPDPERERIARRRDRVLQMFEDGDIDRAEKSRRLSVIDEAEATLEAKRAITRVPTLDWSWKPDAVNAVLRAMWEHVELDRDLQPVRAEWRVPEWRLSR